MKKLAKIVIDEAIDKSKEVSKLTIHAEKYAKFITRIKNGEYNILHHDEDVYAIINETLVKGRIAIDVGSNHIIYQKYDSDAVKHRWKDEDRKHYIFDADPINLDIFIKQNADKIAISKFNYNDRIELDRKFNFKYSFTMNEEWSETESNIGVNIRNKLSLKAYENYVKCFDKSNYAVLTSKKIRHIKEYETAYSQHISNDFSCWSQPKIISKAKCVYDEYEVYSEDGQDKVIEKVLVEVLGLSIDDLDNDFKYSGDKGKVSVDFGDNYAFTIYIEGFITLGSMGMARLKLERV